MNEPSNLHDTETPGSTATKVPGRVTKPAVWFWLIAVAALLWYAMDTIAYLMRVSITEESLANMPEHHQQFMKNLPSWVNGVFALEVFGGLLGTVLLLLRRRVALFLFIISLIGVLCQTFYIWFLSDHVQQMGAMAIVMPAVAIIISLIMIVVTRRADARGWLR